MCFDRDVVGKCALRNLGWRPKCFGLRIAVEKVVGMDAGVNPVDSGNGGGGVVRGMWLVEFSEVTK